MNRFSKQLLVGTLAGTMMFSGCVTALAQSPNAQWSFGREQACCCSTFVGTLPNFQSIMKMAMLTKNARIAIAKSRCETRWDRKEFQQEEKGLTVTLDGKKVKASVIQTEDTGCYMKLADIAAMMAGTRSAFSLSVDENNKIFYTNLNEKYVAGTVVESEAPATEPTSWTLKIDGVDTQMVRTMEQDGEVYYNLRDLAVLYGFQVTENTKANKLQIKSGTGYSLKLDNKNYETGSIQVYGETVNYRVYTVVYASKPAVVAQEVMKIYVPDTADEDSPIIMPLKTGAHMHAEVNAPFDVDETNINTPSSGTVGTGGMEAASALMAKGWVVVTAAARGYDTIAEKDGVSYMAGSAPACITDLKAAVRYLQYNDKAIPGDPDKIVVTGTSGGGTMTTIMGASGNSDIYTPYLKAIGAANEEDDVYAAVPYCPVADIDNMGLSYEWVLSASSTEVSGRSGNLGILNQEIAKQYTSYVNGLGYTDEDGNSLTLDSETLDGTYRDYYIAQIESGLTYYMNSNGYVNEDGTLNEEGEAFFNAKVKNYRNADLAYAPAELFDWTTEGAVMKDGEYSNYISLVSTAMPFIKVCPNIDNGLIYGDVTKSTYDSINILFNTDPFDLSGWSHFEMNLGDAVANANAVIGEDYFSSEKGSFEVSDEVQKITAMYNAMYYIKDYSGVAETGLNVNSYADDLYGSSDVAPYWHIRVGTWDHLVSTSTETTFALALEENSQVKETDFMIAWGQIHTGWFDNSDMIEWLTSLPGLGD